MHPILKRIARWLGRLPPVDYSYPAIDVTLPNERYLHLVGSIHMGTMDMSPLPKKLSSKLAKADALIVEADITRGDSPFGNDDVLLPLQERLSAQQYEQVSKLCEELGCPIEQMSLLPCWQVGLMLQASQAQRLGLRGEYGIDYQLLSAAHKLNKNVLELEGSEQQLELLRQLPEDGLALLDDTLEHWHTNARLLQTMISWWLDTKPNKSIEQLPQTFSSSLYDVLMHQRNQRWQQFLNELPAGHYVVAVGALHLYGDGNLPALLK